MTTPHDHQKVLIVDFGNQVTQLIARRLREASVYCGIHPFQKAEAALAAAQQGAMIIRVHDVAETVDALAMWQAGRGDL